jgi:phospholipid/cholesterol/gamma-HCH transport system substrate-binding protein
MASSRELKVGLVVLGALAVLATGLLVIGDRSNLFVRKTRYFLRLANADGLANGSAVTLDGVHVGGVDEVVLPKNPEQREIAVWLEIDRRYGERLRAPEAPGAESAEATKARIKTLGLLGDKYIELNSGAEKYPIIPDEGEIPSAAPINLDQLVASGGDVMENVAQISHSLLHILARVDRGEGLLGELTVESAYGRQLRDSANATLQSLQRVAEKMEKGDGALPRLLNDRRLADRLASAAERLDAVLASAQEGKGPLPALLNDPAQRAKVDEALANLNGASQDLRELTSRFGHSQALLPRLVADETYGRDVTNRLHDIVEHLDTASERLVEGRGSAALLLNDPSIYNAVNDVIVGVNQSKMLRWLIQNRQKAGIKKRYDDAGGGSANHQTTPLSSPSAPPPAAQQQRQQAEPPAPQPAAPPPPGSPPAGAPPAGAPPASPPG